jgi:hypothetical protein
MQSLAGANGEACDDNSHRAGRNTSQNTGASDEAQYQLIATVSKNSREEFRVAHRRFKNFRGVELRVFKRNGEGTFVKTNRAVALRLTALPDIIDALRLALAGEAEGLS